MSSAFVCLVEVELRVVDSESLKSKRQVVRAVRDALRDRLGAAVAEVGGQDTWQRSMLLCALVGRSEAELARRADRLEEIVLARAGEAATFARHVRSLDEVIG